jgi:hypothetical protein
MRNLPEVISKDPSLRIQQFWHTRELGFLAYQQMDKVWDI